ncbi:3-deoxy-D-arabinoheptulosonate-7-phosphate synthase [Thermosyntropha lipolytica DSM 11003]|uniref:3-deoxy-D-arabinoheptulosonate-7-phosphate synthase n=1 Tax=Thermosyntropha lipolytica DSM 11003 TaxID=1123382 RepID=A0A1M5QA49_9FIRM|nr:3-deoxy-7-phosphoheptulonate synthase [Thermosyntropha lipolytica]SHH10671.1 3-deoxy-D-arabinoheptulosonate-7-phosphate synthase [Thermosyntropha lipolytica DSM 11003]
MRPFKLAAKENKDKNTIIEINTPGSRVYIGEGYCTIIAGPCAVENRDDYIKLAKFLKSAGVHMLRGGLFKPRTSPYSFRGLGREGLDIMVEARDITGLPLITEIMDVRDLDILYDSIDVFQVGSRNMQNFTLLDELGKIDKPVLLKRGLSATIEEWLLAAEYILKGGNEKVILCERGIRTFEPYTRNTLDIGAVALVKHLSHLPVLVDPSHATGKWELVTPVAKAAIAAGADGVMVEVHQDPDRALSDGKQSLNMDNFLRMMKELQKLATIENKKIDRD